MNEHLGGHYNITHVDEGSLKFLKDKFMIGNMIDIGCGPGGMRVVSEHLNISWTGLDGDETVHPTILHDFTKGNFVTSKMFDLGWSVEFVEHVEEKYVKNFMSVFSSCKIVMITAAPPGTPGYHHVNCRTQDYWIGVFAANGFRYHPELTDELKKTSTMRREFIRKSGMLFIPWH